MMRCRSLVLSSLIVILGLPALGKAQTPTPAPAEGQAFGTRLDLLGTNIVDQSDTQLQTAPNAGPKPTPGPGCPPSTSTGPDSFDVCAGGATIPASPLAEVVTGPSRTRGCSSASPADCASLFEAPAAGTPTPSDPLNSNLVGKQFVFSEGGNATASVLIAAAAGQNVLDVVSDGSAALVACAPNAAPTMTATSHVDALVIAGNAVPIPGSQPANTTIVAPQLPLLVLNEQFCPDTTAPEGTTRCIVNAAHAQLITAGQILDLKVSGATASVTSPNCGPGGCGPNFGNSVKNSLITLADRVTAKNPQTPAGGDPIRFTVSAVNSAAVSDSCTAEQQTATNVRVVDRIPRGVTVDLGSITVQMDNGTATSATGTIDSCGATRQFPGCEPEAVTDASRQCLFVNAGNIGPGHTTKVSFIATVNNTATGGSQPGCNNGGEGLGICNVALIESDQSSGGAGTPRASQIICPKAPVSNRLRTTGSGGCSLGPNPSRTGTAGLPVLVVFGWLAARRWRMRSAARERANRRLS